MIEQIRLHGVEEHGDAVLALEVALDEGHEGRGERGLDHVDAVLVDDEEEIVVRRLGVLARQLVLALLRPVDPPAEQLVTGLPVLVRRRLERLLQPVDLDLVLLLELREFWGEQTIKERIFLSFSCGAIDRQLFCTSSQSRAGTYRKRKKVR